MPALSIDTVDSNVGFPLHALLILYATGKPTDLYCNDMEGFKLLVDWLGPIQIPELEVIQIPRMRENYEVQRIAMILKCDESIVYQLVKMLWE